MGGPIIENLLDLDIDIASPVRSSAVAPHNNLLDFFGDEGSSSTAPLPQIFLQASQCAGLALSGFFSASPLLLNVTFSNQSDSPMSDFAIQFNGNSFGISPSQPLSVPNIPPKGQFVQSLPLNLVGTKQKMEPFNMLQIAIKNNVGVYYFSTMFPDNLIQ